MGQSRGVLDEGVERILNDNRGSLSRAHGGLVSAVENADVRSILVTSCNRQEGKTVTAIALASALARQADAQVLLIDGNHANPCIHRHFNLSPEAGLSEYLSATADLDDVICATADPCLKVITLGKPTAPLANLVRIDGAGNRLTSLREKFDYVVCDGSSVLEEADLVSIARRFDGVLLVVECERTRWEVAQTAKEQLTKAGGKLIGATLNKRRYYIPHAIYSGA
jgi:capsular exopolysaccharide synthesis family protein